MLKHLIAAALLCLPSAVFAGQAMSVDECLTLANKSPVSETDTIVAPLQDSASATSRGSGDVDAHPQPDNTAPRGASASHASGDSNSKPHKGGHGRTPWQSLLPGVMK